MAVTVRRRVSDLSLIGKYVLTRQPGIWRHVGVGDALGHRRERTGTSSLTAWIFIPTLSLSSSVTSGTETPSLSSSFLPCKAEVMLPVIKRSHEAAAWHQEAPT